MSSFTDNGITWEWHSVGGRGTSGQGSIGESSKDKWLIDGGIIPQGKTEWCKVGTIFLTHFHHDHTRRICDILTERKHSGCEDPVTFYVPKGQSSILHNFISSYYALVGAKSPHTVVDVHDDLEVYLGSTQEYRVLPFQTYHGDTPSTGWRFQRVDLSTERWMDVAAVTGDTEASVFADPENEFLLRTPLLFIEITYLHAGVSSYEAQIKGHVHIRDLSEVEFQNNTIVGYHFSPRYSQSQIQEYVQSWKRGWEEHWKRSFPVLQTISHLHSPI